MRAVLYGGLQFTDVPFQGKLFFLCPTAQLAHLNRPAERGHEVLTVDWLGDEIAGPTTEGMNHQIGLTVAADHERGRVWAAGPDCGQQLQAVHSWHLDI